MSPRARRSSLTIGAVLAVLSEDFPGITISKIRFLESEGLLTPARTASGYRTYSEADVERLRYILTAQRDHFWPLKVIREALDAMDRGLTPPHSEGPGMPRPAVPPVAPDPLVPDAAAIAAPATLRLTAVELAKASGVELKTLRELEGFGLVRADDSGHYDDSALAVATAAAALAAYGVEPRHLRPFRTAADREVGLVQQVVGPQRTGRGGKGEDGADREAEVLRLCVALHTALVRDGLRRG